MKGVHPVFSRFLILILAVAMATGAAFALTETDSPKKPVTKAAKKAMEVLGPKYMERKGGYTRLIKLNDPKAGASKVILELVD